MLIPFQTDWELIEEETLARAVNSFHQKNYNKKLYIVVNPGEHFTANDGWYGVSYSLIETENDGQLVSRIFNTGIRRKGGVKPYRSLLLDRLKEVAQKLDWERDIMELIEPGWEEEEENWY